jgi:transketolase
MEPNRNRFILSKGHAALALFATLNVFGFINDEKIRTYMQHDSHLIAHPIKDLTLGVESSNGSLGQGLSFGAGIAIAAQIQKKNFAVYVVLGDGECNEGSVWEAALFAGAKNLDNLVAIVDLNDLQSDGEAIDRASHQQLLERWVSFGWDAVLIDGHNHRELLGALTARRQGKPKCIIAQTVKGKGVKFMESDNNWHHAILSKQKFAEALRDLQ